MKGGQGMLTDGFDGNRVDIFVAVGFQKPPNIGPVGFVSSDVGLGVKRG